MDRKQREDAINEVSPPEEIVAIFIALGWPQRIKASSKDGILMMFIRSVSAFFAIRCTC